MGKRTLAALAVTALTGAPLAACAPPKSQQPGETAATYSNSQGEWRHITQLNGYKVSMQCTKEGTGIYVFDNYRGFAVLGNDPLCK